MSAALHVTTMWARGGWREVELVHLHDDQRCPGWTGGHDCGRETGHPGDHVCIGCHDQWNRGPWDDEDDEGGFFESQRPDPEQRCAEQW